jgi:hypothetical protein
MRSMKALCSYFSQAKKGNLDSENEDSFRPKNILIDAETPSFGIADGSTEGSFSSRWSKILTSNFVDQYDKGKSLKGFFKKSYDNFREWKKEYLLMRQKENRPLQWFEENKLEQGAFSTFLGIIFDTYHQGKKDKIWKAYAIGDACLFQVRKDELITRFPMQNSSTFGNNPILISSNESDYVYLKNRIKKRYGGYEIGDHFYIMTDALAKWFLEEYENSGRPWEELDELNKIETILSEFVDNLRKKNRLKNDDTTLVHILITG